jgi:hypothetical protein
LLELKKNKGEIMFLAVNILYLLICLFISFLIHYFIKNKKLTISLFLFLVFAPFWDLILQKGVKNYYEAFLMQPKVYSYPQKDDNGKIESLAAVSLFANSSSDCLSKIEKFEKLKKQFPINTVLEIFLEDSTKQKFNNKFGYTRINLDENDISYQQINDESEFISRYQILAEEKDFFVYKTINVKIWDDRKNILLGEGLKLEIPLKNNSFRNKYLFWEKKNKEENIYTSDNYGLLFKKIFGFNFNT